MLNLMRAGAQAEHAHRRLAASCAAAFCRSSGSCCVGTSGGSIRDLTASRCFSE
jgi:hypothetical protein